MGGCLATARTRGTVILLLTLLAGMAWAQSSLSPELARMLGAPAENKAALPDGLALESPVDPATYMLGPGDRLGLLFYNSARTQLSLSLGSDGWLTLPGLGRYDARGRSLQGFLEEYDTRLARLYDADSLSLWIEAPRRIRVFVGGAVLAGREVDLPYLSRVSTVLESVALDIPEPTTPVFSSTEPEPTASLRNVSIQRGTQSLRADLQRFMNSGSLDTNPLLEAGDRIIFAYKGPLVHTEGPFRQVLEEVDFVPGDTPETIVQVLGGLQPGSEGGQFEVVRQDSLGRNPRSFLFASGDALMANLALQPGDKLYYRALDNREFYAEVTISGEVLLPGGYSIDNGVTTLGDILRLAQPHPGRADLNGIRIYREREHDPELAYVRSAEAAASGLDPIEVSYLKTRVTGSGGRISIYYDESIQDMDQLHLQAGDNILVTRRSDDVELVGALSNQGRVVQREGWDVSDYITSVGGKIKGAQMNRLRVRSRDSDQFVPVRRGYHPLPGDVIFVPYEEPLTAYEVFRESLTIATQVLTVVLVARSF